MRVVTLCTLFGLGTLPLAAIQLATADAPDKPKVKAPTEPRWDEDVDARVYDVYPKSKDLEKDLQAMWRTVPHKTFKVAPVSAINAASRVFATVDLTGKTEKEVEKALKLRWREGYGYHLPFWSVQKGVLAYRFDCGNFGWQFSLRFDKNGKVASVERKWIH